MTTLRETKHQSSSQIKAEYSIDEKRPVDMIDRAL